VPGQPKQKKKTAALEIRRRRGLTTTTGQRGQTGKGHGDKEDDNGDDKTINQMADQRKEKGKQLSKRSKSRATISDNLGIEAICRSQGRRQQDSKYRKKACFNGWQDKHNSMAGTDKAAWL
jgi:hypothetical protein